MKKKYFYIIPIYSFSREEYDKKREIYFYKQKKKYVYSEDEDSLKLFEKAFNKILWTPWKYNQIVGFIELFIWSKDIRGEYYFVENKRISVHLKKKRFRLCGKAFELGIYFSISNEEIYNRIKEQLEMLRNERSFKNRYIDLEKFYEVAPYIDWNCLLGY